MCLLLTRSCGGDEIYEDGIRKFGSCGGVSIKDAVFVLSGQLIGMRLTVNDVLLYHYAGLMRFGCCVVSHVVNVYLQVVAVN